MEVTVNLDFAKLGRVEIYVEQIQSRYRQGRTLELTNR